MKIAKTKILPFNKKQNKKKNKTERYFLNDQLNDYADMICGTIQIKRDLFE